MPQYVCFRLVECVKLALSSGFNNFFLKNTCQIEIKCYNKFCRHTSMHKKRWFLYCMQIGKRRFIMNKEELVKEVSKKAKVSQKATADVVAAALETIVKTVSKGKKVTLVGFGTFEPRKRAARTGRNPQTGAPLKIAAKTVPAFSAGKKFKELVK